MTEYTDLIEQARKEEETRKDGWIFSYLGAYPTRSFIYKNGVRITLDITGSNKLDNIEIPDSIRDRYGSRKEVYAEALEKFKVEKKLLQKQRASDLD